MTREVTNMTIRVAFVAAALLCACRPQVQVGSSTAPSGHVTMRDAAGASVGDLTLSSGPTGVRISGVLGSLPAGVHGIHFHAVGRCEPSAFTTAGSHLNPSNTRHGLESPNGPHAGDLPNVTVGSSGSATVNLTDPRVTLDANGLFDADGTALVIHAAADDQKTDPAGNSGARIACGVIERG